MSAIFFQIKYPSHYNVKNHIAYRSLFLMIQRYTFCVYPILRRVTHLFAHVSFAKKIYRKVS